MQIVGQTWLSLVTLTCGSWSEVQHDLYFMVQWFCLISWRLLHVCTSYYGIMNQYDQRFDLKITAGHCDLICYGPVILRYVLKTIWCMNIIIWDYESVSPDVWPQSKCKSLRPILHGPVILPYILKTIWCMYILLWDYESVWPEVWQQNKCRSLWPIIYGPMILPCILKTVWCMNIIIWDYESVWPYVWPQNKCRSLWPIFHGQVILPYILKTIRCMNIIIWDYESVWPKVRPQNNIVIVTYILWFSEFALYLEDYLMYEHHTSGLWVSMTRRLTSK